MPNLPYNEQDVGDIVVATLGTLPRGKMTDISPAIQRHVGFTEMFKKRRVSERSGLNIDFFLFHQTSGGTQMVEIGQDIENSFDDTLLKGQVDWKKINGTFRITNNDISPATDCSTPETLHWKASR